MVLPSPSALSLPPAGTFPCPLPGRQMAWLQSHSVSRSHLFLGEPQAGRRAALSFGERACVGRFCCCQAVRRTGGPSLNLLRLPFAQIQKAIMMPTRCWISEDRMSTWMCSVLRPVRDSTSFSRSYSPCLSGFCSLGIFFAPRGQRMLRSPVLGECFFLSCVSCPDVGTTLSLKSAVWPGGWGVG